jgi:hypothetical protein
MTGPEELKFKKDVFRELLILMDLHRRPMGPPTIEAYFQAIKTLPPDAVIQALIELRKLSHFPIPSDVHAEVRSLLRERRSARRALPKPNPTEAERATVRRLLRDFRAQLDRLERPREP